MTTATPRHAPPAAAALRRRGWRDPAIPAASGLQPSPRARLIAQLRAHSLDQALLHGADPASSAPLAARAARLTRSRTRRRLADSLERIAGGGDGRLRIRPARGARVNRSGLHELAATLRAPGPVYARGVAGVRAMLRDGAGPLYADRHGEALARELQAVASGLRG